MQAAKRGWETTILGGFVPKWTKLRTAWPGLELPLLEQDVKLGPPPQGPYQPELFCESVVSWKWVGEYPFILFLIRLYWLFILMSHLSTDSHEQDPSPYKGKAPSAFDRHFQGTLLSFPCGNSSRQHKMCLASNPTISTKPIFYFGKLKTWLIAFGWWDLFNSFYTALIDQ